MTDVCRTAWLLLLGLSSLAAGCPKQSSLASEALQVPIILDPTGDRLALSSELGNGEGRSDQVYYALVDEPYRICTHPPTRNGCPDKDSLDPGSVSLASSIEATIERCVWWRCSSGEVALKLERLQPDPGPVEARPFEVYVKKEGEPVRRITAQCGKAGKPDCKSSGVPKQFFGTIREFKIDGVEDRVCVYLLPAVSYGEDCQLRLTIPPLPPRTGASRE